MMRKTYQVLLMCLHLTVSEIRDFLTNSIRAVAVMGCSNPTMNCPVDMFSKFVRIIEKLPSEDLDSMNAAANRFVSIMDGMGWILFDRPGDILLLYSPFFGKWYPYKSDNVVSVPLFSFIYYVTDDIGKTKFLSKKRPFVDTQSKKKTLLGTILAQLRLNRNDVSKITTMRDQGKGLFLFDNGVYDSKSESFVPVSKVNNDKSSWFPTDRVIIELERPFSFTTPAKELVAEVKQQMFVNAMGPEKADYFLYHMKSAVSYDGPLDHEPATTVDIFLRESRQVRK